MGFLDILGGVGDFITDFIPGGDLIDNVLGIDEGSRAARARSGSAFTMPKRLTGGRRDESSLGPFEIFVPDIIERGIGTMPPSNGTSGVPGCNITMPIQQRAVAHCAPGFVAVDTNGDGVSDTCMLKEVAKACKLWRPRPKPIMTASDRRTLTRATSVMRKVDTVVDQTNKLRGQAKLTKARATRRIGGKKCP
jgi:hypothetical protein